MFRDVQVKVHDALADNFDTKTAINHLAELVSLTNSYVQQPPALVKAPIVRTISKYVLKILKAFGVYDEDITPSVEDSSASGSVSVESIITPFVNSLVKFRSDIKDNAASGGAKEMFKLSDELRDDILPYIGIRLEDRSKGQESIWMYENAETLIKEREQKIQDKLKKEKDAREKKELDLKKVFIFLP
jgi:cysteinyl-tRNA synthetase